MNLFLMNPTTFEVDINPEALLLKPFHKILARDRSINKKKAKAELAYIYFMCDFRSDYQSTVDLEQRSSDIIEVLDGLPQGYSPDKLVKDACDFYKERSKSIASVALENQRVNVNTLITRIGNFMNSDDVNTVEKASKLSEKIKPLIISIDDLEKIVKGQINSNTSSVRGNQEKALMEDDM